MSLELHCKFLNIFFCVEYSADCPQYCNILQLNLPLFQVFTSLALFNILIAPLNAFPWVINGLMESWVSLKRVERFLTLHELSPEDYYARLFQGNILFAENFVQLLAV